MNKLAPTIALFAALLVGGCGEEIPENPTWNGEIELMLKANCVRCHGDPRPRFVSTDLRLDTYNAAIDAIEDIRNRAVDYEEKGFRQMPPDSYLSNDQKEILGIWIDNGGPLGTPE